MSSRLRLSAWSIGLVLTLVLVVTLALNAASRDLTVTAALLCLAISALTAEAIELLKVSGSLVKATPPPGARLADGIVEIVSMSHVEAQANPLSPRFRRFLRLPGGPHRPERVGRLPTVRPTLLGQVALISVFVGRDGKGWTDEEIARGHDALERAGLWIEREACRYAARVNLCLADTYFRVQDDEVDEVEVAFADEGNDVGPMEAHASTKAVIAASRVAATLGFADVVDLVGRINPRVEADSRVWLLHLRRSGRSLAIPAEESEIDGIGLAICFSEEESFPEPLQGAGRVDPTTVAHELLHLFGASDKYGVSLRTFPPGSVSSRDIMRLNHDRLPRMTIDGLTAEELGWESVVPSENSTKNARR